MFSHNFPAVQSSFSFAVPPSRPWCSQLFNLFHPSDPSATRIEPLLSAKFSFLKPVPVPRYQKFPLGDGRSFCLYEHIQQGRHLFEDNPRPAYDLNESINDGIFHGERSQFSLTAVSQSKLTLFITRVLRISAVARGMLNKCWMYEVRMYSKRRLKPIHPTLTIHLGWYHYRGFHSMEHTSLLSNFWVLPTRLSYKCFLYSICDVSRQKKAFCDLKGILSWMHILSTPAGECNVYGNIFPLAARVLNDIRNS